MNETTNALKRAIRYRAELEAVHDEYRKATAPPPLGCQLCGGHREHAPHCPSVDVVPREDVAAAMDTARESVNALQGQLTTAKRLLQECLDGSPGRVSSWRTRVEAFLREVTSP